MEQKSNILPDITKSEKDIINSRREARKKKILENAKSRLEKLNGDLHRNSPPRAEEDHQYSDPEIEPNVPPSIHHHSSTTDENLAAFFSTNSGSANTSKSQSKHFVFRYRLHVIFAILVSYAITFLNFSAFNSIFIVPAIMIIYEIINYTEEEELSPIMKLLITMIGVRSNSAQTLIHVLSLIHSLISDLGMMIFIFCTITYCLISLNSRYEFLMEIN